MNIRTSLALGVLVLSSAVSLAAPEPLPLRAPGRLQSAEEEVVDRDAFLSEFRAAMKERSKAGMAEVVRRRPRTAILVIIEICEQIARETNERLETEIHALQDAWEEAFDSKFASRTYEYFALMRQQIRAFRSQRKAELEETEPKYRAAIESRNWNHLDALCETLTQLAEAFSNCGDHFLVSECWYRVAIAYDVSTRGKDADARLAGDAYKKALEARAEIDLKDSVYESAKERADQLLGEREAVEARTEADAAEGFTRRRVGVALGEEVTHDLSFELIDDVDSILRPGYANDPLPTVWRVLTFEGQQSTATFPAFENGLEARREGGAVTIDGDRDGKPDAELRLTGNVEAAEVTLGSGEGARKWGVLGVVLTDQEVYQGITINLGASESILGLHVSPGGSMVGEIAGTPIRVIDEDMDGVYGSDPRSWSYSGLTEGHREPIYDTIVIDNAKRAQPWSEYVQIDDAWYQLVSDAGGSKLKVSPAKLETGKLQLDYDGTTPLYLVVRGSGTFANAFFDVMAGGKRGIEVPVGTYQLFAGELRKGRRTQVMKALILPGEGARTWAVTAGETTEMELGKPYDFDYTATDDGDSVTVVGTSVAITGRGGERYERLWNCTVEPEVFLRKVGTRKTGKSVDMDRVRDFGMINTMGFNVAWFPLDVTVTKQSSSDEVELQLVEKKNKLFGTIESNWRPVE